MSFPLGGTLGDDISNTDLTSVLTTLTVPSGSIFCQSTQYDTPTAEYITGQLARQFKQELTNLRFRYQDDTETLGSLARGCTWFAQYLKSHLLPVDDPWALGDFIYTADGDELIHSVMCAIVDDGTGNAEAKFYDLQPGVSGDTPVLDIVEVTLSADELADCILARF
jgi:hypothetical protein